MAKSMKCAIGTRTVSVDDAIEMRDNAKKRKLDYPRLSVSGVRQVCPAPLCGWQRLCPF
jgi:hypothetical protein